MCICVYVYMCICVYVYVYVHNIRNTYYAGYDRVLETLTASEFWIKMRHLFAMP